MERSGTLAEPSDNSTTPYMKKRPTLLGQPLSVRARASWLSFPSVTIVTSPEGEYTSLTFRRSHALRTAEDSLDHFFCASSGLAVSFPSVTIVTSPQGEFTSPTFGRSHVHRTAEDSLDHLFSCELRASRFRSPLSLTRLLPRENLRLRRLVARKHDDTAESASICNN